MFIIYTYNVHIQISFIIFNLCFIQVFRFFYKEEILIYYASIR